jgi:ketosteroid isomerase-like protein
VTSENLDLVRSIYAHWERGDFSSMEWAHPDIEYVVVDFVEPITRRGREATADAIGEILVAWEQPRIEADEVRPLDDGRILVLNHLAARGRASGLDVGQMRRNGAAILTLSDGMVTRYLSYFDRDRALADLGLAE